MKNFKTIITLFVATAFLSSCSSDDNSGSDNLVGGDHTYDISITSGLLAGNEFEGTVPNEDFMGLFYEVGNDNILNLGLGTTGSDFFVGGAVVMLGGNPTSQLTEEYEAETGTSTLILNVKVGGVLYAFNSISGSCTVSNLQKYGVQGVGVGGASYKLNFSGTFRQANFDGLEQDAPTSEISGNIVIKKLEND